MIACLCSLGLVFCLLSFRITKADPEGPLSGMPCENPEQFQKWFETYEEETEIETQLILLGTYQITFYDDCPQCVGKWAYQGITASGAPCRANHTIACGLDIPFGTVIYIEGLGTYVCEDRGVGYGCIDIYVNNHSEIPSWGMGYFDCYIIY